MLHALAAFTCRLSPDATRATRGLCGSAIMDTLAVCLGALPHPAAQAARRYARHARVSQGARIWGSGETVTAEVAALVNGVPLRGYDYNDLYMGRSGGHPSDIIPALLALAEWQHLPGARLLDATAVGYEVTISLFDAIEMHSRGWDYPTLVSLGATCACARLLGLDEAQTREAIAICAITHFVSDEVESGELNARGDLTMWKRFNGSHAARHGIYACLLAQAGAEGAVRPFEGGTGFLSKVATEPAGLEALIAKFESGRFDGRVRDSVFKRWPVGSRAQSAIQAALEAREGITDIWAVQRIEVRTDPQAYHHFVERRADPWHPVSRETADHSMPYVVAAAVLDGYIKDTSFEPAVVVEPRRQQFMRDKLTVAPDEQFKGGARTGFLTQVEIIDADGRRHVGSAKAPPGHKTQPFSDRDFEEKLVENVSPLFGAEHASGLVSCVRRLEGMADCSELAALLVLRDAALIEAPAAAHSTGKN